LVGGADRYSCSSCHQPALHFTNDHARIDRCARNTPSLVNSVFNRHQFWDGRVDALEETLVRQLADEGKPDETRPLPQLSHIWGSGLVRRLGADLDYDLHFKQVFGDKPSQDTIAKALATYLRTLLAGDSLYDRADRERGENEPLAARHFERHLDAAAITALGLSPVKETAQAVAARLVKGYGLFHGQGRCAGCHSGPLFTDQGFYNTGIGAREKYPDDPLEGGRFTHVPIGLKEERLLGAYRTPTLRGLDRTRPYFHDGSRFTLKQVVSYYNHSILFREAIAQELRLGRELDQTLGLSVEQMEDVVLFLKSLNGEAVDEAVSGAKAPR
jgi:cytochrome c peroxidase